MSRLRTIKPGFFVNEKLCAISPLGRLLFAGVWTIADRNGRLEDRPRRIKAQVLPYDECDGEALINELVEAEFLLRYEVEGEKYLEVQNWGIHQSPHQNEPAVFPAPNESPVLVSEPSETSTVLVSEPSDPSTPFNFNSNYNFTEQEQENEEEHFIFPASAENAAAHKVSLTSKEQLANDSFVSADTMFEETWKLYPRKTDKKAAHNAYKARVRASVDPEDLRTAVVNYAKRCEQEGTEQKWIKLGGTFFGPNERWQEYLVEEPVIEQAVFAPTGGQFVPAGVGPDRKKIDEENKRKWAALEAEEALKSKERAPADSLIQDENGRWIQNPKYVH